MRILRQRLLSSSIAGSYLRRPRREVARRAAGLLRPPLFAFGAGRFADLRLAPAARRALPEVFARLAGAAFFLPALFFGAAFFLAFGTAAFLATGFGRDGATVFFTLD